MESVLRKNFWMVRLVFLILGAWLLAGSINGVIAHTLRKIPSLSPQTDKSYNDQQKSLESFRDYRRIADLNYFGSAFMDPPKLGKAIVDPPEALSGLNATLRGTIVAEPAEWSMALITDRNKSVTGAYRIDDILMDDARIVAVFSDKVALSRSGHIEYLKLEHQDAIPPAGMASTHSTSAGIRKISEDKYVIARSEIDTAINNLDKLVGQVRIVPSFRNGESDGFKLFAIQPGSLFSMIGLQNGDKIHKINGYPINSPDRALEVYQKLKSARAVDVEMTRLGQTRSLSYEIQ